jgi:hypothetical protein
VTAIAAPLIAAQVPRVPGLRVMLIRPLHAIGTRPATWVLCQVLLDGLPLARSPPGTRILEPTASAHGRLDDLSPLFALSTFALGLSSIPARDLLFGDFTFCSRSLGFNST